MKALTLAALTLTSSMSLALTSLPTPPKKIDCGSLTTQQADKIENETSADGLKDLAKTCEEQADGFQAKSQFDKAANAHLYVANFTNSAWLK